MTTISDFNTWTATWSYGTGILIDEVTVKLNLNDLNYATFISPIQINVNDMVSVYYNETLVFYGKVSQCKKLTRTVDTTARFDIELVEFAEELKYKYMIDDTYSARYITNSKSKRRVLGEYVSEILHGTGYIDISEEDYYGAFIVTGGESEDYIPPAGFSVCTVYSALNRIVCKIFGFGIWFEYDARTGEKRIRYGEVNKTASGYPVPTNITLHQKAIDYNVDGIVVYNDDNSLSVSRGNITGDRVLAYRYSKCQNLDELKWIAQRIFEDRENISYRYEIEFPAGWYNIHEGDEIRIGDSLTGLEVTRHGVKDVTFKQEKTIVGIGSNAVTVFDIYSDRLRIIDGDILAYDPKDFDTGYVTVVSGTADYGAAASVDFMLGGTVFLGELIVGREIIDGDSDRGYTVFSIGATDSEVTIGSTPVTISFAEAMDEDWFPWDWHYAEIVVQYIFDSNNEAGSEVEWNCIWTEDGETESLPLVSDGIDYQTASSIRRTITHKWFISQQTGVRFGYPLLTLTNTGTSSSFNLQDVAVNLVIHYTVTGEDVLSEDVIVEAKLDDYDWFTIWDYNEIAGATQGEIDLYCAATYDLAEMFDLEDDNFKIGIISSDDTDQEKANKRHTISFRSMGTGDVKCRLLGSYLAFNEKTEIIN